MTLTQSDRNELFARVFRGEDGEKALTYLREMIPPQGPSGLDALKLAHTEGRRYMARNIVGWVEAGRKK